MLPPPNPVRCKEMLNYRGPATVCLVDADGLKGINDKYGHLAGDKYLETIFNTLVQQFPEFQWERYGGDEFMGIAPGHWLTLEPERAVRETIKILNHDIKIGYSLGYVYCDEHDTPETAIAMADAAMYEAKHVHHGGVRLFEPVKTIGLTGGVWPVDWYVPLIRQKYRFALDYDGGPADMVFSLDPDTFEGIYVEGLEQFLDFVLEIPQEEFEFETEKAEPDEFGEWGMPSDVLEWRTKISESEWEQLDENENIKLRLETVELQPNKLPGEDKKERRLVRVPSISISIPKISLPNISLPSVSLLLPKEEEDKEKNKGLERGIFLGKTFWIWGEQGHSVDIPFARYLARNHQVLFLDGDFVNPQLEGDWSLSWVLRTPARTPGKVIEEKNLTMWGLGKKPPRIANIKALWENTLYSLATTDRVIVVGAGKSSPPNHVDYIIFVTDKDVTLAPPALAVRPGEEPGKIVERVEALG